MTGAINIRTGLRAAMGIAVLASALMLPAQALAQQNCSNVQSDPTAAQYCPQSAVLASNAGSPSGTAGTSNTPSSTVNVASTSGSGSLPFTGLDVGVLVAVAAALTGTGLVLRRLTAPGAHKE